MARRAVIGAVLTGAVLVSGGMAATTPTALADPTSFFTYGGSLVGAPGSVLKTRVLSNSSVNAKVVQIVYRTTDALKRPTYNTTTVLVPRSGADSNKVVSYQSFYDSLDPADGPSRFFANVPGGMSQAVEADKQAIDPLLDKGYTFIVSDIEGRTADFAAGPEYGMATLDSIRAAVSTPVTGLRKDARIGLLGYSGGAIGTVWAAALAPGYAPDVNRRLTGAAAGGTLVNPARNLRYVNGSLVWAGVIPMAVIGVGRSYEVDLMPYLSPYGKQIVNKLRYVHISEVLAQYPGLTWQQLALPQYADPNKVKPLMESVAKINLGAAGTPTAPLYFGQGANGTLEGSNNAIPGVGPGDGVMVAGDVRTLARQYCTQGNRAVKYVQYDALSHVPTMVAWLPTAIDWIADHTAGRPAPTNCGQIAPGNPLIPRF